MKEKALKKNGYLSKEELNSICKDKASLKKTEQDMVELMKSCVWTDSDQDAYNVEFLTEEIANSLQRFLESEKENIQIERTGNKFKLTRKK